MGFQRINGIALDAVTAETASYASDVTGYAVQSGGQVSDHVTNQLVSVSITAVVSDVPIGDMIEERKASALSHLYSGTVSMQVYKALLELRKTRKPFKYEGIRDTWENLIFTDISPPLDATTGGALRFSATMQQIEIRELVRTASASRKFRPSRKVAGAPQLWLCPAYLPFADDEEAAEAAGVKPSDSEAENKRKLCKRVVMKGGKYVFADTGVPLTFAETIEMRRQNNIPLTSTDLSDDEEAQEAAAAARSKANRPSKIMGKLAKPTLPKKGG